MSPGPVIETFDGIKSRASGLCSCLKRLAINAFTFEPMKEAFCGCIIIAISSTAHANSHPFLPQERLIVLARVGTSTIGVMEEPGLWTATSDCHT
jgi:hypothetical protein